MPPKDLKGQTEKFDRCVSDVKRKGTGNPYAICTTSLRKAKSKRNVKGRR